MTGSVEATFHIGALREQVRIVALYSDEAHVSIELHPLREISATSRLSSKSFIILVVRMLNRGWSRMYTSATSLLFFEYTRFW